MTPVFEDFYLSGGFGRLPEESAEQPPLLLQKDTLKQSLFHKVARS